ncbi:alpha/beta hydrolase [Aliikangiella coralliicola]|uniref:Esterase family protein n=1 Tax=Aliikangiella coralliicola TaxID=2592383 RepID=A0A545UJD9_9GAMM|nr:alpha/beta hydrolase-fold protein [Aliikangiella coralliicola]TQV89584.1 esterase family protein [Aliikangiella coralliicola]
MHKLLLFIIFVAEVSCLDIAKAKGNLSENIRIESKILNYPLQYRVYTPAGMKQSDKLPTIYVTDGQWYLDPGKMLSVLDREITNGTIAPVIAVFVDNRNPDNLEQNRRNEQFFCNEKYVDFYKKELLPTIDASYPTANTRESRVIQGVSFGGLNAACFGLMAHEVFAGISMHSPANSKYLKDMRARYQKAEKLPIKIFLSFGKKRDNSVEGRKFRDLLISKGYQLDFKESKFGHEWKNWRPLLDDSLQWFFPPSP